MPKFLKSSLLILVITLFKMPFANAQEVRVIDNKGTITTFLKTTTAALYDISGGFAIPFNSENVLSVGVIIQFDTEGIVDSNEYLTTSTSITILNSGTYKVTYRVTAQATSGRSPSGTEYILLKNENVVPGSYSAAYHADVDVGKDTATASRILVLTTNDVLKVRGNKYTGKTNTPIKTIAQGSSFLVERIK